ncbi:MAG: hypothetical protein JSS35_16380 [Proteobacteria bacterium]|nr:hypothetical protein [Pseudomonadota bacterium]
MDQIVTPSDVAAAEPDILYTINNAPIRTFPYPHLWVPDVFPAGLYDQIQANLPGHDAMSPISEVRPVRGYKERFILQLGKANQMERFSPSQRAFWDAFGAMVLSGRLMRTMITKFRPQLAERFGNEKVSLFDEAMLVEDQTNYALGPHTDSPAKVVTVLFYLPKDDSLKPNGTSIYAPKDPTRRCPGGPHYRREEFDRVATMPFVPNSMFAFPKSDQSWHGVEPFLTPDVCRWLLLYDVRLVPQPKAG